MKMFRHPPIFCDAVISRRRHEKDAAQRDECERGEMQDLVGPREARKSVGQKRAQLETEKRLRA